MSWSILIRTAITVLWNRTKIAHNDWRPSPSRCHWQAIQRHIYQKGRHLSSTFTHLTSLYNQVTLLMQQANISALHFTTFNCNQQVYPTASLRLTLPHKRNIPITFRSSQILPSVSKSRTTNAWETEWDNTRQLHRLILFCNTTTNGAIRNCRSPVNMSRNKDMQFMKSFPAFSAPLTYFVIFLSTQQMWEYLSQIKNKVTKVIRKSLAVTQISFSPSCGELTLISEWAWNLIVQQKGYTQHCWVC